MDARTDYAEVIATPDPSEFVRRAYRLVLRREASEAEVRRGRLLRFFPFYSRDRFLRNLLWTPEGELIQARLSQQRVNTDGLAVMEERVRGMEAVVADIRARLDALAAAVGQLTPLAQWPTPEPYPVSYVCERLDRLLIASDHLRAVTEKVESEVRTVVRPVLDDVQAEWRRVGDLRAFERKVYSQQGEDGILEEIFRRIGETNRYFVEFGVETGVECNAARLARDCGWSGLFMEADPVKFAGLRENYAQLPAVRCEQAFVHSTNVQELFATAGVPAEPDLLVIDIDGNDYWVWRAITDYRPRVVVTEYNGAYPPPVRWVMAEDPNFGWRRTDYYGASLAAFAWLGKTKGYELVGTDSRGVNAFFVRADCTNDRFLDPAVHYHFSRFGYAPYPHEDGPSVEG